MKDILNQQWTKFDGRKISSVLNELTKLILINKRLGDEQIIWIGTDSRVKKNVVTITASVTVRKPNKGAAMCMLELKLKNNMSTKERMLKEVDLSLEVADALKDFLQKHKLKLEVHADINPSTLYKSNEALIYARAKVISLGYIFKCKPDAFSSSKVSDKYMRIDKIAS